MTNQKNYVLSRNPYLRKRGFKDQEKKLFSTSGYSVLGINLKTS